MNLHLVPTPRRLELTGEHLQAPAAWSWACAGSQPGSAALARLDGALRRLLQTAPGERGSRFERRDVSDAWLRLEVDVALRDELGPDGYRLSLRPRGALLVAAGPVGLDHGLTTLAQILVGVAFDRFAAPPRDGDAVTLPGLEIHDRPALSQRAAMLDVSRNRVPRMDQLCGRIEQLASWKVNHLQLYMEHTFAYRGHEVVWENDDPFTPEEIEELDAFCRERHIELAPNLSEQHYALERLGDFGSHYVLMLHREGDGPAEVHDGQTDFYVVQAGSATLHIGGEVVGGKTTEPGEIRGKSLKGAKTRKIAAGDVINIPARLPHQITMADGETITYLIVKVHAK